MCLDLHSPSSAYYVKSRKALIQEDEKTLTFFKDVTKVEDRSFCN